MPNNTKSQNAQPERTLDYSKFHYNSSTKNFDIREHIHNLSEDGGSHGRNEGSYHCPICDAPNFKVNLSSGKYSTFSCDCASTEEGKKKIRDAVAPLERKEKAPRPDGKKRYIYRDIKGNPLIRVTIIYQGGKKKPPFQEYWIENQWLTPKNAKKKGISFTEEDTSSYKNQITLYRWEETEQAIKDGKTPFIVEGEGVADCLWELKIPATTNIMGSGQWRDSYSQLLKDAGAEEIVICPDRDIPGIEHADQVAESLESVDIKPKWVYAYPHSPLWNRKIPQQDGLDLKDFLDDPDFNMSADDLFKLIELERRKLEINYRDSAQKKSGNGARSENINLKEEIDELANSEISKSETTQYLNELSKKSGFLPAELRRMYESRLEEIEKESAIGETQNELETLFKLESAKLNLSAHIDKKLAQPMSRIAEMLGTKPEAFLTTLLPTVASLTKIGTRLELIKATGFYALPILYTGIVGESGTAKSPTQKTILKPLFELQSEYDDNYQRQYEQWLEDCKQAKENGESEPAEPKRKEIWTDDSTSEAIALIQSNQPNDGFLNWRDELSGLIKDNNKYRGKGSDAEKLLSGRDGSPIKVNRASGKRINCKQSGYSITGGTQPDTLRQQIDFDDPTGHWARFLWCILPLTQNSFPRHASNVNIHELLLGIYKQIKEFPAVTYTLSQEATNTYADWYDLLESRKYNEARQGLRTVYSKAKNDTGIIALLLHILNAAIDGRQPNDTIDNDTIKSAISITKFYISQVRLIHSEGDADTGNSLAPLYRKILDLVERKGTITARDVSRSSSRFKKHKPDEIRSLFRELDQMGKAKTSGSGTKLKLSSLSSSVGGVSSTTDDKSKPPVEKDSSNNNNTVVTSDTHFSDTDNLDNQKEDHKTVVTDDKFTKESPTVTTKSTQSHAKSESKLDDKSDDTSPTTNEKTTTESSSNRAPADFTLPVQVDDKIKHYSYKGEIITSDVTEVEIVECALEVGSDQIKKIQRIYYGDNFISSDDDDLLLVSDTWGKHKWQRS
jgi:CRISPR-associated protein Cmr3